jgi:hypothetical protein
MLFPEILVSVLRRNLESSFRAHNSPSVFQWFPAGTNYSISRALIKSSSRSIYCVVVLTNGPIYTRVLHWILVTLWIIECIASHYLIPDKAERSTSAIRSHAQLFPAYVPGSGQSITQNCNLRNLNKRGNLLTCGNVKIFGNGSNKSELNSSIIKSRFNSGNTCHHSLQNFCFPFCYRKT